MKIFYLLLLCFIEIQAQSITKIAFGACAHQDKPQPILDVAASENPDYFIFMGDNIYGDTENMDTLKAKYQRLASKSGFKKLKSNAQLIATWDDHDYGKNDGGKEYTKKKESKEIFLDFWNEPSNSDRRKREGIYTSYLIKTKEGKVLQLILLDTRTFRDELVVSDTTKGDLRDYAKIQDSTKTFLGEAQWTWLKKQLKQPADVRIMCSSTQFAIEYNGYEAWANFPYEQARMFRLIKKTRAENLFFISGDVHYAELSMQQPQGMYPIYDLTSSGITQTWDFHTQNKYRIGEAFHPNHYGVIQINWAKSQLSLAIKDVNKKIAIEKELKLDLLKFK